MNFRILSIAAFAASASMTAPVSAQSQPQQAESLELRPEIDFRRFVQLSGEVADYREDRLVTLDRFVELAAQGDAIILDTRSAAAFAAGHIDGAINLPFSDFTDEKLAKVIGDTDRAILIYCNNNFSNDVAPVVLKRPPLALNISTFINLYGSGYTNIYELAEKVDMHDPKVRWVTDKTF